MDSAFENMRDVVVTAVWSAKEAALKALRSLRYHTTATSTTALTGW